MHPCVATHVPLASQALLASARKEQDEYVKEKNANGLKQAQDIVRLAKETNAKFGGSFNNGVGSNTWAGTPVHAPSAPSFVSWRYL